MADHKHGSMDISGHEKTFASFMNFAKWVVIVVLAFLVFLAVFNG
ncbi:MAG: aa3-type cytochrome c oxidase subunit IV [Pseudomonadota bacterium]